MFTWLFMNDFLNLHIHFDTPNLKFAHNLAFCLPLLQPERFVNLGIEPPKGVLLFGPPGTGKTLCARAVANRTDACFIRVIGSELVQKYVGEVRAVSDGVGRGLHICLVGTRHHSGLRDGGAWRCRSCHTNHCRSGNGDMTSEFNLQFRGTLELGFCSQLCHLFFSWS